MSYLLDSCAWLDALFAPEKLTPAATALFDCPQLLFLSTISIVEFAQKHAHPKGLEGDIILEMEVSAFLERVALPPEKIELLPITPAIAADAYDLPGPLLKKGRPHKDPADLIIVATARHHGLTLLTSDQVLLDYPSVHTLASRS